MSAVEERQAVEQAVEHLEVRRGEYHDSVTLMVAGRAVAAVPGVARVLVAMGTELNVSLLDTLGYPPPEAGPSDLIIAFTCPDPSTETTALTALSTALTPATPITSSANTPPDQDPPRTTATALDRTSGSLALISTPGLAAVPEAMESLQYGASVVIFSDNVPLPHEIRLKEEARRRNLLVMGPDCGTVVLHGTGLGFTNATRPGPISLVAASGTGAQHLMSLLEAAGLGTRHCLGVGGRDLTEEVAGRSTHAALDALAADEETHLIAVVSKPPHPAVAESIRAHAEQLPKPVHLAFIGPDHPTLTEAAERILTALRHQPPRAWPQWQPTSEARAFAAEESGRWIDSQDLGMSEGSGGSPDQAFGDSERLRGSDSPTESEGQAENQNSGNSGTGAAESHGYDSDGARSRDFGAGTRDSQRSGVSAAESQEPGVLPGRDSGARRRPGRTVRGLFSGGTLCAEAEAVLVRMRDGLGGWGEGEREELEIDLTDFGDDTYTRGRPHPMIDNTLRLRAADEALTDPRVGVLLLDVVLGRGAHADPAGELVPVVAAARGQGLPVVVSLCGTALDPQGLERQARAFADAGAWVYLSNAEAALAAGRLAWA